MNKTTTKNAEEKAQISKNVLQSLRQMKNLQKCSLKILSLITQIKHFVQNIKIQLKSQNNQKKEMIYQKTSKDMQFMQTRVKQIQYWELQLEKLKQLINFISEKPSLVKQFVINKVLTIIQRMGIQHFLDKIKSLKQNKQQNLKLNRENFHNFGKVLQKQLHIKRSQSQKCLKDKSQSKIKQQNHLNRRKSQYKQIKQQQEMRFLTSNIKKVKTMFQNNRLTNSNHLNKSVISVVKNKFDQFKRKLIQNKQQNKKIVIEWDNKIKNNQNNQVQKSEKKLKLYQYFQSQPIDSQQNQYFSCSIPKKAYKIHDIISINLQSSQKHSKSIQTDKKSNVQLLKILPNYNSSLSSFNSCQKKPQGKQKKLLNQIKLNQNHQKDHKLKLKSKKKQTKF